MSETVFNFGYLKFDGLVKSLKRRFSVIPAQAGIQCSQAVRILWIPVFTGMATFYDSIKFGFVSNFDIRISDFYQWRSESFSLGRSFNHEENALFQIEWGAG